jgi:phosphoribosylformylglycinamidine cyclo-ligase
VPGDVLIGLASSGIHSNGFSLARGLYAMDGSLRTLSFEGEPLGDMLLEPTKIYVKPVLKLIEDVDVKGIAHITGGGFFENIPRILPEGVRADIRLGSWTVPGVFRMIEKEAKLSRRDAFGTFNMGIGMVVAVPGDRAEDALMSLRESGEDASVIGVAAGGKRGVRLCG